MTDYNVTTELLILAALLLGEVLTGVIFAIRDGSFQWDKLGTFLAKKGPLFLATALTAYLDLLPAEQRVISLQAANPIVFVISLISLGGGFLENLVKLGVWPEGLKVFGIRSIHVPKGKGQG